MKRLIAAAAKGNPDAEYSLGVIYDNRIDDHGNAVGPTDDKGNPIASDRAEAMKWLLRAAEHGHARAQMRLRALCRRAGRRPGLSPRLSVVPRRDAWPQRRLPPARPERLRQRLLAADDDGSRGGGASGARLAAPASRDESGANLHADPGGAMKSERFQAVAIGVMVAMLVCTVVVAVVAAGAFH